jgi:hypothetical protein
MACNFEIGFAYLKQSTIIRLTFKHGWPVLSPGKSWVIVGDRLKSRVILGRGIYGVKREEPDLGTRQHRVSAKQKPDVLICDSLLTGYFASLR